MGPSFNRMFAYKKRQETAYWLKSFSTIWRHREKIALYKAGKEGPPGTTLAGTLIWDSQPPEMWKNIFGFSKPPSTVKAENILDGLIKGRTSHFLRHTQSSSISRWFHLLLSNVLSVEVCFSTLRKQAPALLIKGTSIYL